MIGDAIFSEVGYDEDMVLTWTVHDLLEHVLVDLLLASVWDSPRDSISEFDWWLSLLPKVCRTLCGATSVVFLFLRVDQHASILFVL